MNMKGVLYSLLVSVVLLSFSACTVTQTTKNNTPKATGKAEIQQTPTPLVSVIAQVPIKIPTKKHKAKYLIPNNLTSDNIQRTMNMGEDIISYYLAQIKDPGTNKLYRTLNASIEKDVRKAIIEISQTQTEKILGVSSNMEFCANNIMSIGVHSYYEFPDYGLLYSMIDGRKLGLKDIFIKGVDYVTLINQQIPLAILKGERSEEDLLREPFTTIRPDQNFVLTLDTLYIVFSRNEAGFATRYAVPIPLSTLDPYIDILDRYVTKELEKNNDVRYNNIFSTYHNTLLKNNPFKISAHYMTVSGLNNDFEKTINQTLQDEINRTYKQEAAISLKKNVKTLYGDDPHVSISMYQYFNHNGILCVNEQVGSNIIDGDPRFRSKILTFDLTKRKVIDAKDILLSYFKRNKGFADTFINRVKEEVSYFGKLDNEFVKEFNRRFDFKMLLNDTEIGFNSYVLQDAHSIVIRFNRNTFKNNKDMNPEYIFPFEQIIPTTMQDFFNW